MDKNRNEASKLSGSMPAQTETKLHRVALASTCLAIGKEAAVVTIQRAGHKVRALQGPAAPQAPIS